MEIKNLKQAAQRIKQAVNNQEKIILFADADLDGTTSTIVLEESIRSLGGKVFLIYFPNREEDGYGLNPSALEFLKNYTPGLLITLDCGISNFEELKIAKDFGFDIIVIDHHEILNKVPEHALSIDPKQEGDEFPFKKMATCGIVFYLAKELLQEKFSLALEQSFLELTALATLADLMPEEKDNKIFIAKGILALEKTFRPGLKEILRIVVGDGVISRQTVQRIIPVLNITDIRGHLTETYILLTSFDSSIKGLALKLYESSRERYSRILQMVEEIEEKISDKDVSFVFEGDEQWLQILTGAAASRICNKYKKPAFIFKKGEESSRGSVRTTKDINSVEVLKTCKHLLETYGGHPQASGFTVKNENIDKLKACLMEYFKAKN